MIMPHRKNWEIILDGRISVAPKKVEVSVIEKLDKIQECYNFRNLFEKLGISKMTNSGKT